MSDEQQTAVALFRALAERMRTGDVTLRYDFKRLRHMDSPVAVEAEATRWAYATIAALLAALWFGGWLVGLGVALAVAILYYAVGTRMIERNIRRRIDEHSLGGLDDWQKLWRFGGVTLVARDGTTCAAPDGNWMAFVRGMGAG
ncbi:MAG TPA: hypothetical protein VLV50_10960 [Stellaceae bacterium]|nr:hypothetical protein [Stellaceae bacterium]